MMNQKYNNYYFKDDYCEDDSLYVQKKKVKTLKTETKLSEILIDWRKEKNIPSPCNLESSKYKKK